VQHDICTSDVVKMRIQRPAAHCSTLQHTAAHCGTLQHTAAHCSTMQHTTAHCSTLRHTAPHCSTCKTLQRTATHFKHTALKSHELDDCVKSMKSTSHLTITNSTQFTQVITVSNPRTEWIIPPPPQKLTNLINVSNPRNRQVI